MQETQQLVTRETDHAGIEWARKITEGFEPPRQPGDKPGTYTIACSRCRETGLFRNSCGIVEQCPTCDGAMQIVMRGQRAADKELRNSPSVEDVFFFMAATAVVVVIFVVVILWRSGSL